MSLRVTQTIRASYIVSCGIMTWNVCVWMNRQDDRANEFRNESYTCIYANKIILKLVLVTLYAALHRFQYCWFSSVSIPFFHSFITLSRLLFLVIVFVVVAVLFFSFLFIFSLSTLSLLSPITLFQLYAQERCKSRYCTKSLWHEYWKEIFNTWSKYRNKAVAYLFRFLFLSLSLSLLQNLAHPIRLVRRFNFCFFSLFLFLIKIIEWNGICKVFRNCHHQQYIVDVHMHATRKQRIKYPKIYMCTIHALFFYYSAAIRVIPFKIFLVLRSTYIYFIDLGCRMASDSFTQCQTLPSVFALRISMRSAKPSIQIPLDTAYRSQLSLSLLLPLFAFVHRDRNRGCNKKIYTWLNINNLYEQTNEQTRMKRGTCTWNRAAVNRSDNTFDRVYETTVLEIQVSFQRMWWQLVLQHIHCSLKGSRSGRER